MPLPEHRVACRHLTSMRARQQHTHPQVPPVKSAGKKLSVRPASFLSGTAAHHFPRFAQTFPNKDICGRVPAVPKRRIYAEKRLDYTRSRTHRAARGGKTPRHRGGRPLRHGARDRLRGNRRHRKRRAPLPRRRRDRTARARLREEAPARPPSRGTPSRARRTPPRLLPARQQR